MKSILNFFDSVGYKLRPKACELLESYITEESITTDLQAFLEKVHSNIFKIFIQNSNKTTNILDEKITEEALKLIRANRLGQEHHLSDTYQDCIIDMNALKEYPIYFKELEEKIFKNAGVKDEVNFSPKL
jgi:hypothetical protein